MFDGNIECLEELLSSAEMVLDSRDLSRRSYYDRLEMLNEVRNNLKRYERRECGKFMDSIDKDARGRFTAALALLELSFKDRGERIDYYTFNDKELDFVKAVTRFDYFDLLDKEDILKRIFNHEFIELMRSYILSSNEYIEERLKDGDINFYLRVFFKKYWDGIKGKINEAINEASKYDWFLMLLRVWDKEKRSIDARLEDINKASRTEDIESIKKDIFNEFENIKQSIELNISKELQEEVKGILARELELINRRKEELEDMIRKREEEIERREKEIVKREEAIAKKEEEVKKVIKGELKGHLVTTYVAAMLELIFREKLRSKLREVKETPIVIKAPWGDVTINRWNYERILPESDSEEKNAVIPRNMSIVFGHISKAHLGFGEERIIEVRGIYLTHIDTLKAQGFDHKPATLEDLLNVLKRNLDTSEDNKNNNKNNNKKKYMLIGIASPTGWEESVVKYVAGERSLVFSSAVVILVDLIDNKAIYPENLSTIMPSIDRYARMFIPETRVEEEKRVEEVINELCDEARANAPDNPVFLYKELVERLRGIPDLAIIRVISRYRENGRIEIKDINGERVVICKSMG
jgi:hypothetical protein